MEKMDFDKLAKRILRAKAWGLKSGHVDRKAAALAVMQRLDASVTDAYDGDIALRYGFNNWRNAERGASNATDVSAKGIIRAMAYGERSKEQIEMLLLAALGNPKSKKSGKPMALASVRDTDVKGAESLRKRARQVFTVIEKANKTPVIHDAMIAFIWGDNGKNYGFSSLLKDIGKLEKALLSAGAVETGDAPEGEADIAPVASGEAALPALSLEQLAAMLATALTGATDEQLLDQLAQNAISDAWNAIEAAHERMVALATPEAQAA